MLKHVCAFNTQVRESQGDCGTSRINVCAFNTQVSVSHKVNLCRTSHSIASSLQSPKPDFPPVIQDVIWIYTYVCVYAVWIIIKELLCSMTFPNREFSYIRKIESDSSLTPKFVFSPISHSLQVTSFLIPLPCFSVRVNTMAIFSWARGRQIVGEVYILANTPGYIFLSIFLLDFFFWRKAIDKIILLSPGHISFTLLEEKLSGMTKVIGVLIWMSWPTNQLWRIIEKHEHGNNSVSFN